MALSSYFPAGQPPLGRLPSGEPRTHGRDARPLDVVDPSLGVAGHGGRAGAARARVTAVPAPPRVAAGGPEDDGPARRKPHRNLATTSSEERTPMSPSCSARKPPARARPSPNSRSSEAPSASILLAAPSRAIAAS